MMKCFRENVCCWTWVRSLSAVRRVAVVAILLAGCGRELPTEGLDASLCQQRGTSVLIHLDNRTLYLCDTEAPTSEYPVALGRGGTGKEAEGDNKTPIGEYALGVPRRSSRFGMFIPIGYPRADQKRKGYTGSAIGIHGPSRDFAWASQMNTVTDWTQGCIAVASDGAIEEIAAWVRDKEPSVVYLVED